MRLKPGTYLTKDQKLYFNEIQRHLQDQADIEKIDRHIVSQCAFWLDTFKKAAALASASGVVQTYPTGAMAIHPHITACERAQKNLDGCMAKLGMTPESRQKLAAFQAQTDKAGDPLAELMRGKKSN